MTLYIYTLYSKLDTAKVYVGSTKNVNLSMRKAQHKYYHKLYVESDYKKYYYKSFHVVDSCKQHDDLVIEMVEICEDEDRNREDWWIGYLKECGLNVVNKNRAVFSKELVLKNLKLQYKLDKEAGIIPKSLQYYYDNKAMILAKHKLKYSKA